MQAEASPAYRRRAVGQSICGLAAASWRRARLQVDHLHVEVLPVEHVRLLLCLLRLLCLGMQLLANLCLRALPCLQQSLQQLSHPPRHRQLLLHARLRAPHAAPCTLHLLLRGRGLRPRGSGGSGGGAHRVASLH